MAPGIVASPQDVVAITVKHPISSIDVTSQALADLEINNKPTDKPHDDINTNPTDELIHKPSIPHPQGPILIHPSLITSDFNALRLHGKAHSQLAFPPSNAASTQGQPLLISSPYNIPGHYLDISDPHLSHESRLFATALTALKPRTASYATAAYTEALNFGKVMEMLRDLVSYERGFEWKETSFYIVVFRSQLKEGIDEEYLYLLDEKSHEEATESGGLLKYWFGRKDGERRNMATCEYPPPHPILPAFTFPSYIQEGGNETRCANVGIGFWHSKQDAQEGGKGPWHAKARAAGRDLYESIIFTTHRFTILDGASRYRFEDWVE
jgi:hypothetical protein